MRRRNTACFSTFWLSKPSLSEVMKLNSEPPHIPENDVVSRDLIAARDLVKALIAKLQK